MGRMVTRRNSQVSSNTASKPASASVTASKSLTDNRRTASAQLQIISNIANHARQNQTDNIQRRINASKQPVQLFGDYYAFGAANTTPHIHVYNSGMHLKTAGGHRYNVVKNGKEHAQAKDALEQVRGKAKKKLRQALKRTARDTFGVDLY